MSDNETIIGDKMIEEQLIKLPRLVEAVDF